MNVTERKSHAFDLSRKGDVIVLAKHKEGVVDGIVTGLIVDVTGLPVLLGGLFMGILMLVSVVRGDEFKINPELAHFASPAVVHVVFVIFAALLGLLFVGMAIFLLWCLWRVQSAVFPYECRLKKNAEGSWVLQRKLWFWTFPWRDLGRDWIIWCHPFYSHGDWGYGFQIRAREKTLQLAVGGVFTESKSHAKAEAVKDLEILKGLFEVPGEFKRWK